MRQVVAHVANNVELCLFLGVHDVADSVQVVAEVDVVDEPRPLGVAVLLDQQGDVFLVDAELRLGQCAVELRVVNEAHVVNVELVAQLTHVDAAPRVVALQAAQQLFHVDLIFDVQRPE